MSRAVFQTGLRWSAIASRWDTYREAFENFDPRRVAHYGSADLERLMHADGVLHSARKITAIVSNAQTLLALEARHGTFTDYLRSFGAYDALARDLKKRFKFMGEMNVWYFLFRVREPVPRFEAWVKTIPGDHPRMREMVESARAAGVSTEFY